MNTNNWRVIPAHRTASPMVPPSHQTVVVQHHGPTLPTFVAALVVAMVLAAVGGFVAGEHFHHGPHPAPVPVPDPPKPLGELRVILVSDSAQNMSRGQLNALNSSKAREWLDQNCETAGDGRPAWRSWSKEVTPGGESADWQEAWEAAKSELGTLPQIVIFHGKKGKAYPLPDSESGLLDLLKKHGGK